MIERISVSRLKEAVLFSGVPKDDIILSCDFNVRENLFAAPCRLDAFVLMFCVNGEAGMQINLQHYRLAPGVLVCSVPENIIQMSNPSNLKVYTIIMSSDFLKKVNVNVKDQMALYLFARKHPLLSLDYPEVRTLEKYYYLLEDILQGDDMHNVQIVEGVVHSLFCKLNIMSARYRKDVADEQHHTAIERDEEVFVHFMELLSQHHASERNLSFYSGKIGITPKYLSRLVKHYSGRTAAEWVDDYVVLEAKTMIKHSGYTIQEIAYKLNFPSSTFFGKYFKRLTGMSPRQYRFS